MKKILLFTMFLLISIGCFSQDIISLKSGKRFEVIVTEITPTIVRYKFFSEPNGRVYFVYKEDVAGILYKDGRVDTFDHPIEQVTENAPRVNKNRQPNSMNRVDNTSQSDKQTYNSNQEANSRVVSRNNNQDAVYLKNGSIIRGSIIEGNAGNYIKIATADGSVFLYQMDDIETITYAAAPERRNNRPLSTPTNDNRFRPSYKGIVEMVNYYLGIGDNSVDRMHFNFINGLQASPDFSFGIGIGIQYYLDGFSFYNYNSYNNYNNYNTVHVLFPIFADFRVNFARSRVSPYLSADIGYSFDGSNDFEGVGIFINPTIGVNFKITRRFALHVGVGYALQSVNQSNSNYNYNMEAISLIPTFGLSF